ncbi:uncharacterized protein [Watersipora subatra]|uniref:uncharacterized protein n=1 Tax=Watersipora subatra TaxID=2589382 RepID=UPI00355C1180
MQSGINDNLKELDLSWNGLGLEGCDGLSQFLQVNTTLKVLNVTSNRISQPALRLLTKGLVKNCTLERFMVGKNPITHKGVIEFLVKLKSLQLCKASPIPSLQLIDFSGILVGREVVQLESYVREGFPKLQFVMDSSSIDAALSHNHPKHEYTKLSKAQAQSLFIETLAKTGIEPEYVLPKHAKVMWQLDEVMELLTALSVPLTPATIKLMLKKNATDGVIVPSQILSGCDKRGGLKSCVQRAH